MFSFLLVIQDDAISSHNLHIVADSASLDVNFWSARELAYETTEWNAIIHVSFSFFIIHTLSRCLRIRSSGKLGLAVKLDVTPLIPRFIILIFIDVETVVQTGAHH